MSKRCSFYLEVKDLEVGDSKTFNCNCPRHKGQEIVVYVDVGWPGITTKTVKELALRKQSKGAV